MNATQPTGMRLLEMLRSVDNNLGPRAPELQTAVARLRADRSSALLPPLRNRLDGALLALEPAAAQASELSSAGRYAPSALGGSSPQNYLILLPNPSEIRPTGGFSGAIGTVTLAAGSPLNLEVKNQDDYNPLMKKRVDVPTPLARYLKFYKNGLELGDAGWDPDFPTSAQTAEQLLNQATAKSVDGTISIDPYAIAALLEVTGPVEVPGYGQFDKENFFSRLNVLVNASSGPGTGKAALPPISRAVLNSILNVRGSDWLRLARALKIQADQRHIQAYFHDPALAAATAGAHFDGALVAPGTDYLMLADANVGSTKGDAFVKKSMQVLTEVHPELGVAWHQVTVTYNMPLSTGPTDLLLNPGDGSYRDYLRFVLPQEALVTSLTTASGDKPTVGAVDAISLAHSHQIVGAFIRVPRGSGTSVVVTYEVPLTGAAYRLYVQKQAGVLELPVTATVSFPGGVSKRLAGLTTDFVLSPG
ncbi:MAG: DUF4012 domain-containing protein [Candidatus Dormibacteria bacterium]